MKRLSKKSMKDGRRIDVLAIVEGKKITIEVETGLRRAQSKVKVPDEVDELIRVSDNKVSIEAIQIKDERVRLAYLLDYLDL